MKSIISFGKFDKKFLCINLSFFLGTIIFIIILLIFVFVYPKYDISKNKNIFSLPFSYFFGQILCLIPNIIIKNCFKKRKNSIKNQDQEIELIYNVQLIQPLNWKEIIKLVGISLLSLLQLILLSISNIFEGQNNNNPKDSANKEIYFFNQGFLSFIYIMYFILCKLVYKQKYYKHQYFSILILTIIELIKYFIFVCLNYDIASILLSILNNMIFSLLNPSVNLYKKFLIEKKYFSIYKTCYIFGFINVPIILIISSILTLLPHSCGNNEKCYIVNINSFFSDLFSIKFIIYFFFFIYCGFFGIMNNLVLTTYSPFHLLLPLSLCLFILEIISNIYEIKNIIIIISDIFEVLLILVLLEVIELNFCGLNENTKKNISSRSKNETNIIMNDENDDNDNDNDNDDNKSDDSNEEENNNNQKELDNKELLMTNKN